VLREAQEEEAELEEVIERRALRGPKLRVVVESEKRGTVRHLILPVTAVPREEPFVVGGASAGAFRVCGFWTPNSCSRSSSTRRLVPRRTAISSLGRSPFSRTARSRSWRSSPLQIRWSLLQPLSRSPI